MYDTAFSSNRPLLDVLVILLLNCIIDSGPLIGTNKLSKIAVVCGGGLVGLTDPASVIVCAAMGENSDLKFTLLRFMVPDALPLIEHSQYINIPIAFAGASLNTISLANGTFILFSREKIVSNDGVFNKMPPEPPPEIGKNIGILR